MLRFLLVALLTLQALSAQVVTATGCVHQTGDNPDWARPDFDDRQWTKDHGVTGLFYGGEGFKQLVAQLIGCGVLVTVIFGMALAFFTIQNKLTKGGIRSEEADELEGLDIPEMGTHAYPDFALVK